MFIKDSIITFQGHECDKIGVNYEAFRRQSNSWNNPYGTCLRN